LDAALVLPHSLASALSVFLSGAKRRVGFRADLRSPLLTDRLRCSAALENSHVVVEYFALLEPLEIPLPEYAPEPLMFLTPPEIESVGEQGSRPFVAIAPFTAYGPSKEWGIERFKALARALRGDGLNVAVLGSTGERTRADSFDGIEGITNLVGSLTLRETAALLSGADLLVGNDSGLAHLASSVGTRAFTIFGATSPDRSRPLGRHRTFFKPQSCSPCYKRTCPMPDHPCMDAVEVEEVLEDVRRALSDPSFPEADPPRVSRP
jgi:heptosyltransferase-2